MKQKPLVTIYITNHNYGKFIKKAINSVLSQTYRNFELIIIDDGSTDNSKKIINKYKYNSKIKIFYQANRGLTVSNNLAIRASQGKYIMRLDADDWLDSHAIEILSNTLEKNKRIGLVFPDYYEVNSNGKITKLVRRHNFKKVKLYDQPAHGACTMIKKEFLKKIGGYNEKINCQDGYDLWVRFIEKYKVTNINLPLFYYRKHSSSLTRNEDKILKTRSKITNEIIKNKKIILKKAIAIIPVRGLKINPKSYVLKKLKTKNLINWILDTCLKSNIIAKTIVATSDKKIISYLKKKYNNKILIYKREEKLAQPNFDVEKTIKKSIKYAKNKKIKFNYILQLNFRSPFVNVKDIETSVNIMEIFGTDEVIGVRSETDRFYQHNGSSLKILNDSSNLRLEREEIYRETGSLRITKSHSYQKKNKKIGHTVLNRKSSHYIQTDFDWKLAKII
tara:strand:+ start:15861 stop:17204 length:1344 start_codon:yes stop_codon:yes gene_type:complete